MKWKKLKDSWENCGRVKCRKILKAQLKRSPRYAYPSVLWMLQEVPWGPLWLKQRGKLDLIGNFLVHLKDEQTIYPVEALHFFRVRPESFSLGLHKKNTLWGRKWHPSLKGRLSKQIQWKQLYLDPEKCCLSTSSRLGGNVCLSNSLLLNFSSLLLPSGNSFTLFHFCLPYIN